MSKINKTRKCDLGSCHERFAITKQDKKYCQKHCCPEPTCLGVDQCQEHSKPCKIEKCNLFIHKKSNYEFCKPHRCYVKECRNSHECFDHYCKCRRFDGKRKKLASESGCDLCKCPLCPELRSNCKEHCCERCWTPEQVEGSQYCFLCKCSVDGCLLSYRKCPHKCNTKDCFSRRSENGYCEKRCFFKGEPTVVEAKDMILKIKEECDKLGETCERYNCYGFDVYRLDFVNIQARYRNIEFLKTFKIAVEKVEKRPTYLPDGIRASCIDYCSRDYCECAGNYRPEIDDEFSVLEPVNKIFGEHFKLNDDYYILSDKIRTNDGKYAWAITRQIVHDRCWNDKTIYEAIQCIRL